MTLPLARGIFSLLALALLPHAPLHPSSSPEQSNPQRDEAKDTILKYAGTWEGRCQDGRTFVVLDLRVEGNQIGGTVSIGNMHGDDEGACMLVTAPPVPEHAQRISGVALHNGVLSFDGSQRADGRVTHFEFRQADQNKADLKLRNTPVEQHPWSLEKVRRTD